MLLLSLPRGSSRSARWRHTSAHAGTLCMHARLQVITSPEATKRSFLERKGLTAAEIDEAFRRAPPPPTAPAADATTAPAAAAPAAHAATTATPTHGANNLVTYTQQQQPPAQQPYGAAPPNQLVPAGHPGGGALVLQQQPPPQPQPIRWTQVRCREGFHVLDPRVGMVFNVLHTVFYTV